MPIPKYQELFNVILISIKNHGGSVSISELEADVAKRLYLTDKEIAEMHDKSRTKLQYQLAWARTYLRVYGLIDNPKRRVWVLTEKGKDIETVDPHQVVLFVWAHFKGRKRKLEVKT